MPPPISFAKVSTIAGNNGNYTTKCGYECQINCDTGDWISF